MKKANKTAQDPTLTPQDLGQLLLIELKKKRDEVNMDEAKFLIAQGADLTMTDLWERNALFYAIVHGFHDLVVILAEKVPVKEPVLQAAIESSLCDTETFRYLVSKIENPRQCIESFILAIKKSRVDLVQIFIDAGVDINNEHGAIAIARALYLNTDECLDFLLSKNVNVNSQTKYSDPPLIMACYDCDTSNAEKRKNGVLRIKKLLAAKADPNIKNTYGRVPLYYVAKRQSPETIEAIELLYQAGARFEDAVACTKKDKDIKTYQFLQEQDMRLTGVFVPSNPQEEMLLKIFNAVSGQKEKISTLEAEIAAVKAELEALKALRDQNQNPEPPAPPPAAPPHNMYR